MTTTTPFTPNKQQKTKFMKQAEKKVTEAINALKFAKSSAQNWAEFETITAFQRQLEEFISSDSGEAGFAPYCEKISS